MASSSTALVVLAGCAPTRGVGVAPLRVGVPLVSYEESRASMAGVLRIALVAPDHRDDRAREAMESAFAAADRMVGRGKAADAAASVLREAGFDDFDCGYEGARYFAGDAGGKAWSAPLVSAGKSLGSVEIRDEAVATVESAPPPSKGLISVTIVGPDTTSAESSAATVLAATPEFAVEILQAKHLQGVLVATGDPGEAEKLLVTSGLRSRVDLAGWSHPVQWLEVTEALR